MAWCKDFVLTSSLQPMHVYRHQCSHSSIKVHDDARRSGSTLECSRCSRNRTVYAVIERTPTMQIALRRTPPSVPIERMLVNSCKSVTGRHPHQQINEQERCHPIKVLSECTYLRNLHMHRTAQPHAGG